MSRLVKLAWESSKMGIGGLLLVGLSVSSASGQPGVNIGVIGAVAAAGRTAQGGGVVLSSVFGQSMAGNASGGGLTVYGGYLVPELAPTAATVTVSGQVFAPDGQRTVRGAAVTISDASGFNQRVATNTFGHFAFPSVAVGKVYVISVESRRYRYQVQVVDVVDSVDGMRFIGEAR